MTLLLSLSCWLEHWGISHVFKLSPKYFKCKCRREEVNWTESLESKSCKVAILWVMTKLPLSRWCLLLQWRLLTWQQEISFSPKECWCYSFPQTFYTYVNVSPKLQNFLLQCGGSTRYDCNSLILKERKGGIVPSLNTQKVPNSLPRGPVADRIHW